jgi:hypothetical protein
MPEFRFDTSPIDENLPVTPLPAELRARLARVEAELNQAIAEQVSSADET